MNYPNLTRQEIRDLYREEPADDPDPEGIGESWQEASRQELIDQIVVLYYDAGRLRKELDRANDTIRRMGNGKG